MFKSVEKAFAEEMILLIGKDIESMDVNSEEFKNRVELYHKLCEAESKCCIDAKTWKLIICSLGGIGLVLLFEKGGILTTKALPFISKV